MFLLKVKKNLLDSPSQASFFYAWVLDEGDDERSQGFSDVRKSKRWTVWKDKEHLFLRAL